MSERADQDILTVSNHTNFQTKTLQLKQSEHACEEKTEQCCDNIPIIPIPHRLLQQKSLAGSARCCPGKIFQIDPSWNQWRQSC